MKRYLSVFIAVAFTIFFFVSCSQSTLSDASPTPMQIIMASALPTESVGFAAPTSTPVMEQNKPDLTFADLANTIFIFCGGAGAWSTEVKISSDGTFSGYYSDLDMGDSSAEYPNGTQYVCSFSGKFSDLTKAGEYECSMKCESLAQEGSVDEVKIGEDGIRYITAEPYGFEDADEFILYLPGKRIDELPVGYTSWVWIPQASNSGDVSVLPFYGLYNVGGEEGFGS